MSLGGFFSTPDITTRLAALKKANEAAGILPGVLAGGAAYEVPAPRAEDEGPRRRRGAADNPAVFSALVTGGGVGPCMFQNLDLAPFTSALMAGAGFGPAHMTTVWVLTCLREGRESGARQQVIAEVLAPYYPQYNNMTHQDSRELLERMIGQTTKISLATWFLDITHRMPAIDGVVGGVYNRNTRIWVPDTTLAQKLMFIHACANDPESTERTRSTYPVFIMLIAFATRGTLSRQKADRIMAELRPLMPTLVQMFRIEDVAWTFQNFGQYVDDTNVHTVIQGWIRQVPQSAIRLRVLLAQAAGSGLTSLDLIARALHEHPNFPWAVVGRMYPTEWSNVEAAFRAVDGRIYYGFRKDLGAVKATKFRPITWIAHTLLIQAGDTTLENYRGIVKDTKYEKAVARVISDYMDTLQSHADHMVGAFTPAEIKAQQGMVLLARKHPSVAVDLASMTGHSRAKLKRSQRGAPGEDGDDSDDSGDDDDDSAGGGAESGGQAGAPGSVSPGVSQPQEGGASSDAGGPGVSGAPTRGQSPETGQSVRPTLASASETGKGGLPPATRPKEGWAASAIPQPSRPPTGATPRRSSLSSSGGEADDLCVSAEKNLSLHGTK